MKDSTVTLLMIIALLALLLLCYVFLGLIDNILSLRIEEEKVVESPLEGIKESQKALNRKLELSNAF